MSKKLKFGLPKGSLQEATIQKMAKAGYNISVNSRSYMPYVDDDEMEIRLLRAQEISRYVEHGYLDCGITGTIGLWKMARTCMRSANFFSARRRGNPRVGYCACRKIQGSNP